MLLRFPRDRRRGRPAPHVEGWGLDWKGLDARPVSVSHWGFPWCVMPQYTHSALPPSYRYKAVFRVLMDTPECFRTLPGQTDRLRFWTRT